MIGVHCVDKFGYLRLVSVQKFGWIFVKFGINEWEQSCAVLSIWTGLDTQSEPDN